MTGAEQTARIATKIIEVLKDLPLWLLIGLAASAGVLLWIPPFAASLPPAIRPFVVIAGVIFGVLAVVRATALLLERIPVWRAGRDERRRFHLTAEPQQSFWSSAKQSDDSIVTQVVARFVVKNRTEEPLALTHARLVKPRIRGEIVHEDVSVRAVDRNIYGDAAHSGHLIPPKMFLPASASVMVRGVPRRELGKQVRVKIGISDDEGREQFLTFDMRVLSAAASEPAKPSLEIVSSILNPVEREVVTVLQAELARYEKCGRRVGGLGSVHLTIDGREMTGVGTDSWSPNSPKNQSISANPDGCDLRSDNLDALMAFYNGLSATQKEQFASALLARMDGKAYLPVTYFIVCVLWKIGRLKDALEKAKANLPQGEIKVFGLSNALMLLNGLLRYRHPDFANEMLDDIERFLVGLNEHPFQIPEKLAAIRTARLMAGRKELNPTTNQG
ncbi:MAG TPA: hypothetical protein VOA64_00960 [Candidatus Dormibacteraeota bacterium]|nr:hypothetical protein [Candidatus Dormibacteraeota bacterium]